MYRCGFAFSGEVRISVPILIGAKKGVVNSLAFCIYSSASCEVGGVESLHAVRQAMPKAAISRGFRCVIIVEFILDKGIKKW